ncbi:hypothetical protein HMPREF3188_00626 [Tissierellia bacterium KA00581]|nr:hypothetical protein HMPREF3188_00626 [Tissierellia bacterium KA00581]
MKVKNSLFKNLIYSLSFISLLMVFILIFFLFKESVPFLKEKGLLNFIFSKTWNALDYEFGLFNILYASFYIAFLACIISFSFSYAIALYICFYTNKAFYIFLKWLINILAGIPSIIYGFFGLFVIVKFLEKTLKISAGETVLAASLILSIMIIPYFVSNLTESFEILKKKYKKDSDALAVTKEFFIRKIIFKKSFLPIITGFVLAFSRAIGETMAVMMVIGNAPIPCKILSKAETVASLIALEVGQTPAFSLHYKALFASGFVLLFFVLILNVVLFVLNSRKRDFYD